MKGITEKMIMAASEWVPARHKTSLQVERCRSLVECLTTIEESGRGWVLFDDEATAPYSQDDIADFYDVVLSSLFPAEILYRVDSKEAFAFGISDIGKGPTFLAAESSGPVMVIDDLTILSVAGANIMKKRGSHVAL